MSEVAIQEWSNGKVVREIRLLTNRPRRRRNFSVPICILLLGGALAAAAARQLGEVRCHAAGLVAGQPIGSGNDPGQGKARSNDVDELSAKFMAVTPDLLYAISRTTPSPNSSSTNSSGTFPISTLSRTPSSEMSITRQSCSGVPAPSLIFARRACGVAIGVFPQALASALVDSSKVTAAQKSQTKPGPYRTAIARRLRPALEYSSYLRDN